MKLDLPSHIFSMNPLYLTAEEHETDFYLHSPCSRAPEALQQEIKAGKRQ